MGNVILIKRAQLFAGASTAILATAMLSVPAQAQSITTDTTTLTSVIDAHVAAGDQLPQTNTGAVLAQNTLFDATTDNTGVTAGGVFENNDNVADATAMANRNGVSASLATIGSTATLNDDGIALNGVSINSGATADVRAGNGRAQIGTTVTDFATGSVDVSRNTTSATVVINEGTDAYAMAINGSEPVGYTNTATANAAVTTDLSGNATDVADLSGTLLVNSVQAAVSTKESYASTFDAITFLTIQTTADGVVTGTATLDGNAITSSFTANARTATIGMAADDGSTAATAAVSNAQRFDANDTENAAFTQGDVWATIRATTIGLGIETDFVDSSLSVSANTLSAEANGNTASTQIALADGLAYDTAAANTASIKIDELDTAATPALVGDISASAGLVGVSTQLVETGSLKARSTTRVLVDVVGPDGSSIDVAANRLTATATGNNLSAGISSGSSSAVFDASVLLASRQELDGADVSAITNSDVFFEIGRSAEPNSTFVDSTVTVDRNVIAASAVGSRGRQTIDLEATSLNATDNGSAVLSTTLDPAGGDSKIEADGAVLIASALINTGSDVLADVQGADLDVTINDGFAGNAENTSVAVTSNVQQAFAMGSDAGNSLSLAGVAVGSGAGISNLQTNDATSTVTATQTMSIDVDYTNNLISGSSEISGNNQSAIARGTLASNTLAVTAQSVALGANGTHTNTNPTTFDANVTAAFGVVNVQQVLGSVEADVSPNDTNAFRMDVAGGLTDANTAVNSNTLMAQSQGTVASNAITLDIGTLTSLNSEGDAAIANVQNVAGANILATARGNGEAVAETEIDNTVLRSSVETSGNRIMASAESARAANTLSVSGTSLSGSTLFADAVSIPPSLNDFNAQFGIANTQVAGAGNVTASLRETTSVPAFGDSAGALTDLNSNVDSSSITSSGNLLQALASSNRATNAVNVDGTTLDKVTSGLANAQVSEQAVSALIGFNGAAATAGTSATPSTNGGFSGSIATTDLGVVGTQVTNNSASALSFTVAALSAAEATYLTGLGFGGATTGSTSITIAGGGGTVDFAGFTGFGTSVLGGSSSLSFTGFTVPGTSATPAVYNAGGVLMDIEGPVASSSLAVEGNAVQGSSIGNSAANSMSVIATKLDGIDSTANGVAYTDASGVPQAFANADAVLASKQELVAGSSSTTTAFTTFGIDVALDTAITDSNLSVSGNSLYGEAIGNTVTNSLSIAGTDLSGNATSGALTSVQNGNTASISAETNMEVVSNAVSSGSSIALDGNTNNALGVVNNATNVLAASSTNSAAGTQAFVSSDAVAGVEADATGSFALVNAQSASGTLLTTAVTDVYNVGGLDADTTGLVDGMVSMSGNATRSESTANRAANTMSVGADANLGSTAVLVNQQSSSASSTADATSNTRLAITGDALATPNPLESLNNSSVSIEGNSTLALARGNSASNTLRYTAGASYTAGVGPASINAGTGVVTANAALLNDQENTGPVSATASGGTSVALNAGAAGTVAGVLNANVSNSNNSTTAFAVGNTTANTVILSSLNTGMPNVALGNQQTNTGAVTATASSVTYSIGSNGTFGASSFVNSGNAASATAIGNSSVSIIGAQ